VVGFESGVPVSLDGRLLDADVLIAELNQVTGAYGFGRLDMVENRRVGIKSRETYECPGALALLMAHADLEDLTLERDLHHEKARLEPRWSELVYDGLWFSPLKQALDAFFLESQTYVTGEVRLRCEPGKCFVVGRRSPVSLYDYGLATYDAADTFRHQDAAGFVRLWGQGVATWSARQQVPSKSPGSAAPGSAAPDSATRLSAAPDSATRLSAAPVSADPVSATPGSADSESGIGSS
jgi:argininosuccinate synthase